MQLTCTWSGDSFGRVSMEAVKSSIPINDGRLAACTGELWWAGTDNDDPDDPGGLWWWPGDKYDGEGGKGEWWGIEPDFEDITDGGFNFCLEPPEGTRLADVWVFLTGGPGSFSIGSPRLGKPSCPGFPGTPNFILSFLVFLTWMLPESFSSFISPVTWSMIRTHSFW